jgi:hypothetical protein
MGEACTGPEGTEKWGNKKAAASTKTAIATARIYENEKNELPRWFLADFNLDRLWMYEEEYIGVDGTR